MLEKKNDKVEEEDIVIEDLVFADEEKKIEDLI